MPKQFRMTNQRRIILEELCKVTTHPTADEIYEEVRKILPKISLGTVYRNLETLSEQGLALKLDMGGTQRHFDGTVKNHYHLRCHKCGKVADIDLSVLDEIEEEAQKLTNFQIDHHNLEFVGRCQNCQKNQ